MTADDGVFTVPSRQRVSCRHLAARTGWTDLVPSRPSWRDLRRHCRPRPSDGTVENTGILNYFCISATVKMYPDLVLYTWLYSRHCIYICHGISKSATVSAVLYICHGVSATVSAVLYICYCIFHYVSAAVYPTLVSTAVYSPLCIRRCGSAAVDLPLYLPLYISHCVCCIVYQLLYLLLYIRHCFCRCISTAVSPVYPPL